MRKQNILILEDNLLTARGLQYLLEQEGYRVEVATRGAEMRELLERRGGEAEFDLAILDVGLPDGDGFRLGTELKMQCPATPLIFLTAKDDEADIVRGLELGAEDYVTKPFRSRELLARVKAILRRAERKLTKRTENDILEVGPFRVDPTSGEIWRQISESELEPLNLTALESRLFRLLLENPGRIVTRERLLDEIWDASGSVVNDNTVSVYLRRIRQKIGLPDLIETSKNLGYRLNLAENSAEITKKEQK